MLSTRRAIALGASAVLVLAVACIDFQHSNPFDPVTPVTVRIFPETLFSVANGPVTFTLATEPPLTDPTATWGTGGHDLVPSGNTGNAGVLYSYGAPLWPQTETVPILVGIGKHYLKYDFSVPYAYGITRTLSGSVVITQRLIRIRARCAGPVACDSLAGGAVASVFVDGFDALGTGIPALFDPTANPLTVPPIAVFTARDTAIASVTPLGMRVGTISAKQSGSTWIVAQRDSLRDSVRVVVR